MTKVKQQYLEQAKDWMEDMLVWDNHACMPLRPDDTSFLPQLERYRQSHVDVVSLNIGFGDLDLATHQACLDGFIDWITAHPDNYVLAHSVGDINQAKADGKLAILFDIEGLKPFDDQSPQSIEAFAKKGVRWALIAYNRNNASGGGCMDDDGGLTDHGRAMVGAMEAAGMVVCCSHTGHRTVRDVMDSASGPVIFSHSNASAVHQHARNIPDDLITAAAQTGGVIGINGIGEFLGDGDDLPALMADHIDHMVTLVGAEHVGLGLDCVFDQQELIDYLTSMPETFQNTLATDGSLRIAPPEAVVEVTAHLIGRGYARPDVAAILGGNWMRVADQSWHRSVELTNA